MPTCVGPRINAVSPTTNNAVELDSFQPRASYLLDQDQVREEHRKAQLQHGPCGPFGGPNFAERPRPRASGVPQLVPQESIFGGQRQSLVHCSVMYARKRARFISSGSDTQAAGRLPLGIQLTMIREAKLDRDN